MSDDPTTENEIDVVDALDEIADAARLAAGGIREAETPETAGAILAEFLDYVTPHLPGLVQLGRELLHVPAEPPRAILPLQWPKATP